MIVRSFNTDQFKGIDNNYQELKEKYPEITSNGDTPLDMEYHYNELQRVDYANYLTGLGKDVLRFYNTFKINEGECWRTCFFFCMKTDPKRFEMVEGYYEGLKSLYHWQVIDTTTGRLIDPHFDLAKFNITDFTITKQIDIWSYQDECEEEERKKKEEEKKNIELFEKLFGR